MTDPGSIDGGQLVTVIVAALDKAKQLAEVACDWNLDEVEIDGEMVRTRSLIDEFDLALAAIAAKDEEIAYLWEIISYIDTHAPRADSTCDEPGITLSEAARRAIEDRRR